MEESAAALGLEYFDEIDEDRIWSIAAARTNEANSSVMEPIDLEKFLIDNYDGKLSSLRSDKQPQRPYIVAFHHFSKNYLKLQHWLDIFYKVCLKYAAEGLHFVVGNFGDGPLLNFKWHKSSYEDEFHLRNVRSPPWIYGVDAADRFYNKIGFVNVEELCAYAEKLLSGELFTSEPLSNLEAAASGKVQIAVGEHFDKIVLQSDKDVFLNLYAPWCYFSNELLPMLDQLAEMLKVEPNIVIVKINSEANYVPLEFYPDSYPTSYYIPRKNKSARISYGIGPRNLENLLKFIATNATDDLKVYDRAGRLREES